MTEMANENDKKQEDLADAYVQTMKNTTRASIVFQLIRKPEMTATEISRKIGEDVDVVYYHMKFLKRVGLVSEPRVEVRGNYLEKYYSLAPEVRKSLGETDRRANKRMEDMNSEEFRQLLLTAFALVKSTVAGSANQIERAKANVIDSLKKNRNFVIRLIYCAKGQYYELLKDLKEYANPSDEIDHSGERGYTIALLAMPKLDEE